MLPGSRFTNHQRLPTAVLLAPKLRSVQFSSVQFSPRFDIPVTATLDARGYLDWTLLGIYFLCSIIIFQIQFSSKHHTGCTRIGMVNNIQDVYG